MIPVHPVKTNDMIRRLLKEREELVEAVRALKANQRPEPVVLRIDELGDGFTFTCPGCGEITTAFIAWHNSKVIVQSPKFCPGCGAPIEWEAVQ